MRVIKRHVIPFYFSVPAGADIKRELWTVTLPCIRLKEIELYFEDGAREALLISLYYGEMKIAPIKGEWEGYRGFLRDTIDGLYFRGDKILMRMKNRDGYTPHWFWGSLEIEEVEEA